MGPSKQAHRLLRGREKRRERGGKANAVRARLRTLFNNVLRRAGAVGDPSSVHARRLRRGALTRDYAALTGQGVPCAGGTAR